MAGGDRGSVVGGPQTLRPDGFTGSQLATKVAEGEQCSLWTWRQVGPKELEEHSKKSPIYYTPRHCTGAWEYNRNVFCHQETSENNKSRLFTQYLIPE